MVINYSIKLKVDNQENNVFFFKKNLVCGIIEKCSMNNFKMVCSIPLVHIPFRSNNSELMIINSSLKLKVDN